MKRDLYRIEWIERTGDEHESSVYQSVYGTLEEVERYAMESIRGWWMDETDFTVTSCTLVSIQAEATWGTIAFIGSISPRVAMEVIVLSGHAPATIPVRPIRRVNS